MGSNTFGGSSTVGARQRNIPFTGGGPVAQPWTPTFSGAGASLEVHFLNLDGAEILIKTYTLSATVTGIYGIGTFLADLQSQGNAYPEGFIAYCRNANIALGRTGTQKQTTNSILYDAKGNALVSQPEILEPGDALHWAMIAGSNGWKIYRDESSSSGATPVIAVGSLGTDRSGTITTGGLAQVAAAANVNRAEITFMNPFNATESLFWSDATTASASTYETKAGGTFTSRATNAISVFGATTAHAFVGTER